MVNPDFLLANVDQLHVQLQEALNSKDWDALAELSQKVKQTVSPLMDAMERGDVSPNLVKQRLESLNQFVLAAEQGATRAREEARESLQGVNKNRNAAQAYANISSNRSK
ncbi:SOS cell division inhibitor [Marinobacter sp.]|uniref:SOS cell division inhibitor n=1 Tax=Marinobacter sp. TaxID=50741 RepID=UPI00356A2D95